MNFSTKKKKSAYLKKNLYVTQFKCKNSLVGNMITPIKKSTTNKFCGYLLPGTAQFSFEITPKQPTSETLMSKRTPEAA